MLVLAIINVIVIGNNKCYYDWYRFNKYYECKLSSIKTQKQSLKLSFICVQNKVPVSPYQLDDSKIGFEIMIQTDMGNADK